MKTLKSRVQKDKILKMAKNWNFAPVCQVTSQKLYFRVFVRAYHVFLGLWRKRHLALVPLRALVGVLRPQQHGRAVVRAVHVHVEGACDVTQCNVTQRNLT